VSYSIGICNAIRLHHYAQVVSGKLKPEQTNSFVNRLFLRKIQKSGWISGRCYHRWGKYLNGKECRIIARTICKL